MLIDVEYEKPERNFSNIVYIDHHIVLLLTKMILKLESSLSSPVPTSLKVSIPLYQPATFPFLSISLANTSR